VLAISLRTSKRIKAKLPLGSNPITLSSGRFPPGNLPFSLATTAELSDTDHGKMLTPDNFQYAMETTQVIHEPDRRIETFGVTRFEFEILSEPMDSVGKVCIRRGEVEAQKPKLIKPDGFNDIELDGFDPTVLRVIEHLKEQGLDLSFLQYGFHFKCSDVSTEVIHDQLEAVSDKALEAVRLSGNPSLAIIQSVDDAWEVGIMKFTLDMIMKSADINRFDFKRRGLL